MPVGVLECGRVDGFDRVSIGQRCGVSLTNLKGTSMTDELTGKRIAFLVAKSGVEQVELTSPWKAVENASGTPVLLAPEKNTVQTVNNDLDLGDTFDPDDAVSDVTVADFAALVLPGGVANPDKLRLVPETISFVRGFAEAGKPIAAISHRPWSLVEAGALTGKTLSSWPSLHTDITNAGGRWRDERVFTWPERGYTLVTSRKPEDLDAFDSALVEAFATS
jgi:protease I